MSDLTPPLKWHGGKHYLARGIIDLMPPHIHYVEPYAGGLAVLLAKDPEGVSEVVNDLDGRLINFWRVLQDANTFEAFRRRCEATPFAEDMWQQAKDFHALAADPIVAAWLFFVFCRQSMAGRMKCFSPITRRRTRRGMNEQASAWLGAVEGLAEVHARLRRVLILNRPAEEVIISEDAPQTLFYLDPPYKHETRNGPTPQDYAHEMTDDDHERLLILCRGLEGKFVLSGYPSTLYNDCANANRWHRTDFDLPNHASHSLEKRRMTECVWTNFAPEKRP